MKMDDLYETLGFVYGWSWGDRGPSNKKVKVKTWYVDNRASFSID